MNEKTKSNDVMRKHGVTLKRNVADGCFFHLSSSLLSLSTLSSWREKPKTVQGRNIVEEGESRIEGISCCVFAFLLNYFVAAVLRYT
jgi:hypothetical protein